MKNKDMNPVTQDFINFKDTVENAGYTLIHESPNKYNLLIVRLRNNIKVEMRYKNGANAVILAAYKHKQLDLIKQWFVENGYEEPTNDTLSPAIKQNSVNTPFVSISQFLEVCNHLEDVDGIVATQRGRGIELENYYRSIARQIKINVEEKTLGLIDRTMFDKVDRLISENKPLSENSYREHVVPCKMIIDQAIRMFQEFNMTVGQVAKMIEDNLKIVHITNDQAKYLDQDLGLRTTMPAGWKFGDNIYARLDVANIDYPAATICRTESA